ncbi:zinc dependent phospholipase C family protein [Candidatus Clostridium stratigraminis]|uniref:Zinc dependent phospholipase C family protein n=1 Tax=Candidatus Clostridium stratigraminis TaxID=3381661 RepID=A0ABW8T1B7_9CLOT
MVAGTHITIANIVYKYLYNKLNFKLDWPSFSYGNILPDLDRTYVDCEHNIEDSLDTINCNANELINSKVNNKEFSLGLGIICHFICDYFCLYHTHEYQKENLVTHVAYEGALHANLLKKQLKGGLNLRFKCKTEDSVELMVLKLRKKYINESKGIDTDINFSVIAAVTICEMITRKWLGYNAIKSNDQG